MQKPSPVTSWCSVALCGGDLWHLLRRRSAPPESPESCPSDTYTIFRALLFDSLFCPLKTFALLKGSDKIGSLLILRMCVIFFLMNGWLGVMMELILVWASRFWLVVMFLRMDTVRLCFPQFCCWFFSPLWWSGTGNFSIQLVACCQSVCRYFQML